MLPNPAFFEQDVPGSFNAMCPRWVTLLYTACDLASDDISRYYMMVKKIEEDRNPPGSKFVMCFESCKYHDISHITAVETTLVRIKEQRAIMRRILIQALDSYYTRIDRDLAERVFAETAAGRMWPGTLNADAMKKH